MNFTGFAVKNSHMFFMDGNVSLIMAVRDLGCCIDLYGARENQSEERQEKEIEIKDHDESSVLADEVFDEM